MARKIPLITARISVASAAATSSGARGADGVNGTDLSFTYGDMMKTVLTFGNPQKGLVLDEVIKAVDAVKSLDQAMAEGAEYVTFTEQQWHTLREKLDTFPFAIADIAIAEFGLAIRNAPEIT